MDPKYHELSAEQVDRLLGSVLGPGADLEYAESFLGDIGKALGKVGKVVVKALPGAISGAISGAPAGLPGIIGGALIGGASSVLSGGSTPAVAPTGQAADRRPIGRPGLQKVVRYGDTVSTSNFQSRWPCLTNRPPQ